MPDWEDYLYLSTLKAQGRTKEYEEEKRRMQRECEEDMRYYSSDRTSTEYRSAKSNYNYLNGSYPLSLVKRKK